MMTNLDKWIYTRIRYESIKSLLEELKQGMHSEGNDEYGIQPCIFCKSDCDSCDWKNLFNLCRKQGGPGHIFYDSFANGIKMASAGLDLILEQISDKIQSLEKSEGIL